MSENANTPPPSTAEVRAHLHTISELLRQVHHLGPEAQALLADLVDDWANRLNRLRFLPAKSCV